MLDKIKENIKQWWNAPRFKVIGNYVDAISLKKMIVSRLKYRLSSYRYKFTSTPRAMWFDEASKEYYAVASNYKSFSSLVIYKYAESDFLKIQGLKKYEKCRLLDFKEFEALYITNDIQKFLKNKSIVIIQKKFNDSNKKVIEEVYATNYNSYLNYLEQIIYQIHLSHLNWNIKTTAFYNQTSKRKDFIASYLEQSKDEYKKLVVEKINELVNSFTGLKKKLNLIYGEGDKVPFSIHKSEWVSNKLDNNVVKEVANDDTK